MGPQKKSNIKVQERGVVTVEFAILLPLIVLILVGLMEGGHLWHLQHTVTNASREGARAAILYNPPYSPAAVTQAATQTVDNYLRNYLPWKVWETEVGGGVDPSTGALQPLPTTYSTGAAVTVRVITNEGMLLLDTLIPAFQDIKVQAETTMKLE
ncbi:MAG: pilus assembly protein [Deltaproteobacteria bacterium]|nr:pilus assembly protein [Desulfitobacteriaceae bacterium]MDI6855091.1 pilus assembly protein [Deltaproteobacteria bacterium]